MILEPKNIKPVRFHCFPIYLPWSHGTRCHDLSFLSFKPTFSLSSFTLIKRLFSSSLLCAISWGYWYFSQQSWFQLVLHPAQYSAWCTLHTALMYSLPNLEPVHCSMSCSNYCFLTCIAVSQQAGKVVSLVLPSLEEFSTISCDPHNQRLWHGQ